jgi:hypothetical protein
MSKSTTTPKQSEQDKTALRSADFRRATDLAEKNAPTSVSDVNPGNQLNPEVKEGQDADFNSWVRAQHEGGSPEQFSPMQAAQNVRDRASAATAAPENRLDDPNHEDTLWVAKNVKGEPVQGTA